MIQSDAGLELVHGHAAPCFAALVLFAPVPAPAAIVEVGCDDGADTVVVEEYIRHTVADNTVAVAVVSGEPIQHAVAALAVLALGAGRTLVPAPAAVVDVGCSEGADEVEAVAADDASSVAWFFEFPCLHAVAALAVLTLGAIRTTHVVAPAAVPHVYV